MLKKIILFISFLILTACSSGTVSKIDRREDKEIIKQIVTTPAKKIYLLGEKYDYEFSPEESKKIFTLLEFKQLQGLTEENLNNVTKYITIDEEGNAKLHIGTTFSLNKTKENEIKDESYEKEQGKFVEVLKTKLKEKDIKYSLLENEKEWVFTLPDAIDVKGKIITLANRNEILEKFSNQPLNMKIDLNIYYYISKSEYRDRVVKDRVETTLGGALGLVVLPVAAVIGVVLFPVFLMANMQH